MRIRQSWAVAVLLVGLPLLGGSCRRAGTAVAPPPAPVAAPPLPGVPPSPGGAAAASARVSVQLTEEGFVPSRIPAQVGKPITLAITRKTDKTCAHEILFKGQPGKTELPLNQEVEVSYTPQAQGTVPFGCAMGMMVGGALEVR